MGGSMARALAAAGFEVVCWNRTSAAAEALAGELGGRAVRRPADVAAAADICVSMLADGDAVATVFRGPDGLLSGARSGNVFVDSSTVPPSTIRGLADDARAEGGGLTIMVGGEEADLETARPVLDALAKTVFHMGPLGSGAAMKLAVNTVIFGLNQALAEGLVLAEAAGIDRARAYDVLAASAVGAPYVGYKRAAFLEPDTTPVAFALELAAKDLRLIEALSEVTGVPVPQARTNLAVIAEASRDGKEGRDFSAVAEHLRGSDTHPTERSGT
jgi:3-hydroxyisobutyrate dehydrogenase-like beta-hydroxyacid dehydrogenase